MLISWFQTQRHSVATSEWRQDTCVFSSHSSSRLTSPKTSLVFYTFFPTCVFQIHMIPCVNKTALDLLYGVFIHFRGGRLLTHIDFVLMLSYHIMLTWKTEPVNTQKWKWISSKSGKNGKKGIILKMLVYSKMCSLLCKNLDKMLWWCVSRTRVVPSLVGPRKAFWFPTSALNSIPSSTPWTCSQSVLCLKWSTNIPNYF